PLGELHLRERSERYAALRILRIPKHNERLADLRPLARATTSSGEDNACVFAVSIRNASSPPNVPDGSNASDAAFGEVARSRGVVLDRENRHRHDNHQQKRR